MNTCEELIKRIEDMTASKPVVTNSHQPLMVTASEGECGWLKKTEVLATIKEACNA